MKTFFKVWLGVSFIAIGIGVGILIIAFATGANWEEVTDAANFTSIQESYEGVENLDFDIGYGKVRVVEGDNFNISADNIIKGEVKSYVKDGTWYIKEDKSRYTKMFGMHFNMEKYIYWDWGDHFTPDITITVPEGFKAGHCTIGVGAGTVNVDDVNATECDFHVDTGRLEIDRLTVDERSQYKVGAGEMVLQDVNAKDITVDCGVGNFEIKGAVTGDNNIKCGIGNVDLTLVGNETDYNYDVDCGIGDVDIDGDSYRGLDHDILNNHDADNSLHLDCGIGNISVDFN